MNAALAQLQEKQAALAEAQEKLQEVSLSPSLPQQPLPDFWGASRPPLPHCPVHPPPCALWDGLPWLREQSPWQCVAKALPRGSPSRH